MNRIQNSRFHLTLVPPKDSDSDWASTARQQSIHLADVLEWQTAGPLERPSAIHIEVATEKEAQAIVSAFQCPKATRVASPIESNMVVIYQNAHTPLDQLRVALEKYGPLTLVKTLCLSPHSPPAQTPLILATFKDASSAFKLIKEGHLLVRGDLLRCRRFFTGIKQETKGQRMATLVKWVHRLPADLASVLSGLEASNWFLRICLGGVTPL